MAQKIGKILICDRCGDSVFLNCIGEGETDGGYTKWNKFEVAPDGWNRYLGIGILCPKCNSLYTDIVKSFMNKESIIVASDATSGYVQGIADSKKEN